mgnify:CR=1 FL=1
MIRSFLIVLGLVMFYPAALQAKGTVNVGDTIPHDLVLQDSSGKMRSFSDLKGDSCRSLEAGATMMICAPTDRVCEISFSRLISK